MTYNEIIKALEKYSGRHLVGGVYVRDAIDFINLQKAEIERLEAEVDKQYEQAEADILANMADGGMSCHWCITEHKAEAIKEFAEAYKEQIKSCTGMFTDDGFYVPLDAVLRIVEFCKEQMIGEQE